MDSKIFDIVVGVAETFNQEHQDKSIPVEKGADTPLFGEQGSLDSLGLVTFIIDVEQAIEDELDVRIEIVSEKAMSQTTSPFLTIGTLVAFIEILLKESDEV